MKKLAFIMVICLAGIGKLQAQQLPNFKWNEDLLKVKPMLKDSIARLPGINKYPFNIAQLNPGTEMIYSNMPYFKIDGRYNMPVIDPVTPGVNYTMLVKKIDIVKPGAMQLKRRGNYQVNPFMPLIK